MKRPDQYLCGFCDELKPPDQFYDSKLTEDGKHPYCKACNQKMMRKRRARRSEVIDELKTGPCAICGLALKGRPDLKRIEPLGDRMSEARLKEVSGKRFAEYCEGSKIVCLLCLEELKRPPKPMARRPLLMPFVD